MMVRQELAEELIETFNSLMIDGIKACDVMSIEVQENRVICHQLVARREVFEASVSKLVDVWRPIVKRFGLFIGQRHAGIRFLDLTHLGIYFGVENAEMDLIAPDQNQ